MIEVLILSLVQGVTEFLPISSSSHLILISEFFNFQTQSLSIDVSLHIGSFIAVITYFRRDLQDFFRNIQLFIKIIVSSLPVMIAGLFLVKTGAIDNLRSVKVIGWTTLIFGLLLYLSDRCKLEKKLEKNFTIKTALVIGFLQILSLIPGVSRSGITITTARILNFERVDSAKISFLLSIPTLAAVSFFGLKNMMLSQDINFTMLNLFSIILSFIFSFLTIKYFIKYVKRYSLNVFVFYRVILGLIIISLAYL